MSLPVNSSEPVSRRTALKTGSLLVGTTVFAGSGLAETSPNRDAHELHPGESTAVGCGEVTTYATTDSDGELSSLGVHIDGTAMDEFGDEAVQTHLHFPTETSEGDALDLRQFTFVGFHYEPNGHPPPEIYDVPHFDFHYYMIEEEPVEDISGGPLGDAPLPFLGLADYDIPAAQIPSDYMFEEHRFIVEGMGEHLLDSTAPEFQGEEFTHTYVYGVYDPDIDLAEPDDFERLALGGDEIELPVYEGDGEGRQHFVEPMVTTAFIRNELTEEVTVDVATPVAFFTADRYPTAYVMRPDGDGGVFVSVDEFEAFPGSDDYRPIVP